MSSKRKVVLVLLAFMLLFGIALQLAPSEDWAAALEVSAVLGSSLLVFAWYFEDARERSFRRGYWQDFGVAGLALIGLPIYLFRSRGAWRGALATGGAVLYYLLLLLVLAAGGIIGLVMRMLLGMPMPPGLG